MKVTLNGIPGTGVVPQGKPSGPLGGSTPFGHSLQLNSSAMGGLQGLGNGSMSTPPRRQVLAATLGHVASTAGQVMGKIGDVVPLPAQARLAAAGLQTVGAGLTAYGNGAGGRQALAAGAQAGVEAAGSMILGRSGKTEGPDLPPGTLLRKFP